MRELELYIKMTELEQRVQLSARLPSLELYNHYRMGSGAVGVLVAIHEYISSPSNFIRHLIHTILIGMLWELTYQITLSTVPP